MLAAGLVSSRAWRRKCPSSSGLFASDALIAAFNRQIGNEMLASLQYVSIASFLAVQNLPELARTFFEQGDEERAHAMKFVHFVTDVGGSLRCRRCRRRRATSSRRRSA